MVFSVTCSAGTERNGTIYYDAPVEIHGVQDLNNFSISREQCVTIHMGKADKRIVYFFQTEKRELAEFLWRELTKDHVRNIRQNRCMVPGMHLKGYRHEHRNIRQQHRYGILEGFSDELNEINNNEDRTIVAGEFPKK